MSQLVQIKQRIKAIETIQKITHAMRLISMSSHSRLRSQEKAVLLYKEHVIKLLRIFPQSILNEHSLLQSHEDAPNLVIIVGSQKGLCGSFNNNLASFFYKQQPNSSYQTMFVGKKIKSVMQEHLENNYALYTVATYEQFSPSNFVSVANEITTHICNAPIPYASISLYSNHAKTFFMQEPRITKIFPLNLPLTSTEEVSSDTMVWDVPPQEILNTLMPFYVRGIMQQLLYASLLAEYAARFVSMDSATRNAHHLLESTQLVYNKLRQAKITKELTELTSSMQ